MTFFLLQRCTEVLPAHFGWTWITHVSSLWPRLSSSLTRSCSWLIADCLFTLFFFYYHSYFSWWGIRRYNECVKISAGQINQHVHLSQSAWAFYLYMTHFTGAGWEVEPKKRTARGKFGYLLSSQVADSQHLTPLCDHICKPATWYHTYCVSWWKLLLWPE